MESCSFHAVPPLLFPHSSTQTSKPTSKLSFPTSKTHQNLSIFPNKPSHIIIHATLRSPKGFGSPKKKSKNLKGDNEEEENDRNNNDNDEEDDEDDEREEGVIPEIVTNRMMSRVGLSVGIPLFTGLAFFPFFYYLKVGLKIDVPTWVPFIVSFIFFGTALLGVSYGIVSSSWDPLREGSFWGWTEAQKNWPVFLQSLRGTPNSSSSKK